MTPAIRRKVERSLCNCNTIHGKGEVLKVVWANTSFGPAILPYQYTLYGVVVRQHQGHVDAVQFTVAPDFRTLRMLSQTRPVL